MESTYTSGTTAIEIICVNCRDETMFWSFGTQGCNSNGDVQGK